MEWFAFVGIVIVVVVFALWRGRSRTPMDDSSPTQGLPDDLRDKVVPYHVGDPGTGFGPGPKDAPPRR